jgi:hypothetical protein
MHGAAAVAEPGFVIRRGTTVITEIGVEVKILAKAMIKQIDRVVGDLTKQAVAFSTKGVGSKTPLSIAVVGVNHSPAFLGYEANRTTLADGTRQPDGMIHSRPCDEAARAKDELNMKAHAVYSEFLILEFEATNMVPYPFKWVNGQKTLDDYNALLSRLASAYEASF